MRSGLASPAVAGSVTGLRSNRMSRVVVEPDIPAGLDDFRGNQIG